MLERSASSEACERKMKNRRRSDEQRERVRERCDEDADAAVHASHRAPLTHRSWVWERTIPNLGVQSLILFLPDLARGSLCFQFTDIQQ